MKVNFLFFKQLRKKIVEKEDGARQSTQNGCQKHDKSGDKKKLLKT